MRSLEQHPYVVQCLGPNLEDLTLIYWVVPPPSNSGNEGLVRDSLLKGTTPLDDFRKKYMCAFLPMELRTDARAKTPKPLELRCILSFFLQVWKHAMLFFCARGIILCSGDGHLVDKAAFRTFWTTD